MQLVDSAEARVLAALAALADCNPFLPERIDVTLDLPPGSIQPDIPTDLTVSARYLFGAPAGDLPVEGEYLIRPTNSLEAWPGYSFGRYDERPEAAFDLLPSGRTGPDGSTRLPVLLPIPETDGTPLEARLTVRVSDGGGRPDGDYRNLAGSQC